MRKLVGVASHHDWEVQELGKDREFAVEYLKVALESLDNPEERGASLLMLRALAEAYGGVAKVAAEAGISRESLYRSLSPKGNPTMKTLIAVITSMGLRLSVVEKNAVAKKRTKTKSSHKAA